MTKLNLIIPMAGSGNRFKEAGYPDYKPFLKINGKYMVDHVIDAFPESVQKHLLVNPELLSEDQRAYLEKKPNTVLIDVQGHKNGPAYSIIRAKEKLPLGESFFVAYVDVFWTWDFSEVEKLLDHDGIAFCRRKFHPHLINNNFSGFYLPDSETGLLKDLKVKGSFTDNWMTEPLDVAVYYIKSGKDMVDAAEKHIQEDKRVAGEFFVPLVFEELISAGKKVALHDVDFFIHWGVPEQFEDFLTWKSFFGKEKIDGVCINIGEDNSLLSNVFKETFFALGIRNIDLKKENQFFLTFGSCLPSIDQKAFDEFLRQKDPNVVFFTVKPSLVQKQLGCKEEVSASDLVWFKDGSFVPETVESIPALGESLKDEKIAFFEMERCLKIFDNDEFKEYHFWNSFKNIFLK